VKILHVSINSNKLDSFNSRFHHPVNGRPTSPSSRPGRSPTTAMDDTLSCRNWPGTGASTPRRLQSWQSDRVSRENFKSWSSAGCRCQPPRGRPEGRSTKPRSRRRSRFPPPVPGKLGSRLKLGKCC
jgi:hypothetical protein